MLHLSWMNDVSYHYFFEAVASFSCGISFVPFTVWLSGDMDRKNKPAITLKNTVCSVLKPAELTI